MKKWSTMTLWLLVSAAVMGCGGASDMYVPPRPARWIAMDDVTYAFIGREALEKYGYEEIIRLGVEAGFLRYPEQTNAQNFVGQTLAEAASQAWPVFTKGAVMASITALIDSPAPGPADAIAIGMLFAAIAEAGYVGVQVWTSSTTATATPVPTVSAIPTATATTTTTSPPIAVPTTTTTAPPIAVPRRCLPCLPVPVGGHGYEYHSAAAGNDAHFGMANHTHHFRMNQSPPAKGCRCFWDNKFKHPTRDFSPLPGAVPVSPHGGGGIAP